MKNGNLNKIHEKAKKFSKDSNRDLNHESLQI